MVYISYNETHRVNLNQLLLKEGYAEAKDYPNEFNPDVWIESPLEYVALLPSPSSTPTLSPTTPSFEFVFAIIGVLAAMYLIKRRKKTQAALHLKTNILLTLGAEVGLQVKDKMEKTEKHF